MLKSPNTRRWLNTLGNWLFGLVLAVVVFLAYGNLPNRWYHVLYINSGSMVPAIHPGDLIIITPKPAVLKPGMILTLSVNGHLVTHRLMGFGEYGQLITQGDANTVADDWGDSAVSVVGLYRARIPWLGYLGALPGRVMNLWASGAWFTAAADLPGHLSAHAPVPPDPKPTLPPAPTETAEPTQPAPDTPSPTPEPSPTLEPLPTLGWPTPTLDPPTPTLEPPAPTPEPSPPAPTGASLIATLVDLAAAPAHEQAIVKGQACVLNLGPAPATGLVVVAQVQFQATGAAYVDLLDAAQTVTALDPLAPGALACLPIVIKFAPLPGAHYQLVARATIANHAGWLPGEANCPGLEACAAGPTVAAEFELPPAPPLPAPSDPPPATPTQGLFPSLPDPTGTPLP